MKIASFGATVCLLTGCSFINSLDSVKPEVSAEAGAGGHTGKGGKGSGGMMDAGAGGQTGTGGTSGMGGGGMTGSGGAGGLDAGVDASDSGSGDGGRGTGGRGTGGTQPTPDAGDSGTFTPGGPNGAIVLYDTNNKKLLVLDPTDGHLLSAEAAPRVAAIANDPISDNWYLFEQPGTDMTQAQLQVRELNTTSGAWHIIGRPVAVPAPQLTSVGVLNKRIAYLSAPATGSADQTTSTLTVLDTTKPDAVTIIGAKNRALPTGNKLALIANPDGSNPGGSATIVISTCGTTDCDVSLFRETINATTIADDPGGPKQVGKVSSTGGQIGFSYDYQNRYAVLMFPPLSTAPLTSPIACKQGQGVIGVVSEYDPATNSAVGNPSSFDIASLRVSGGAFDSCHQIAFATSLLDDPAVWAVPFAPGGTPYKLCSTGGGTMIFEPFTHSVLRIPIQGDRIELYTIKDDNPAAPTLQARGLKLPSFGLSTAAVAVRQPLTGFCN